MIRRPLAAAAALSLLLSALTPSARADEGDDDCGGTGWILDVPECSAVGSTVTVVMRGPEEVAGRFFASLGEGPIPTSCGTLCLDVPFLVDLPFVLDREGRFEFETELPEDPELIGIVVYAQFITCKPEPGVSNQAALEIIADLAPGDFVTYTQQELGVNCEGFGGPACRVEEWFDVLFPNGLILGDQDGPDGDDEWSIVFTSPAAIAKFLPEDGPISELDGDAVDPVESPGGAFVGHLLAAKLNYALDQAGAYDDLKLRVPKKIGDLIFKKNVNRDLIGWPVDEYIEVCDLALSGALGEGDLDLDGDGELDAFLTDLSDALKEINENFKGGGVDLGSLRYR